MMKRNIVFKSVIICCLLLSAGWSFAQNKASKEGNGLILGRVMDAELEEPLPFVTIKLKATQSGELIGDSLLSKYRMEPTYLNFSLLVLKLRRGR
jgi:hypothetical protein